MRRHCSADGRIEPDATSGGSGEGEGGGGGREEGGGRRNGSQKVGPLARVSLPGPGTLLCATRCDPIENISHPCGQMCLRDWLLQEFDPVTKPALMHNGITRIT